MKAIVNNLYLNDFLFAGVGVAYKGRLVAVKATNPYKARAKAKSIARGLNSECWRSIVTSKIRLLPLVNVESWRNVSKVKLSFTEYAAIICK